MIAGQAQVTSAGATTFVNQSSAKAIINWQDFSVGAGAAVQFNQPNSASITLNRVTGSNLSTIDGAIRANGQVWLLNPNGLLFGNGASINVGGLLATSSDIANQDFLEGRYNFSGGRGAIVNNGSINVINGGSVVLSAPHVTNRGLIQAHAGHVVLGGTDTFTVDFNGDHLLSYAVGASAQTGQVTNAGKIQAQGGKVLMTARAAAGVQEAVINNSGMVEATSARSINGEIILDAGEGAATTSGTLDASGKGTGETGGTVKVLGRLAAVPDNASIDVSGDAGGGTVLIGGNFRGQGPERNAQNTSIGKAVIKADAITRGNGGKVAVWADGRTDFAGTIDARGGALGGNGGQVETSGHELNIPGSASVSTLAVHGASGSWLLDPQNINITAGGNDPATGETFVAPPTNANVDPAAIDVALRGGDVTLQATTDIVFLNNLTISSGGTAGRTLTLQAGRSINLNSSSLSYAAGNVVMVANDPGGAQGVRTAGLATIGSSGGGTIMAARLDLILLSDGVDFSSIGTGASPLTVVGQTPTYIKTLNANAWLTSGLFTTTFRIGDGTATYAAGADLGTGSLTLTTAGVAQTLPILVGDLTITRPPGGAAGTPITLTDAGNVITGTLNISARGRNSDGSPFVQVTNSGTLNVTGIDIIQNTTGDTGPRGPVSLTTIAGDINLNGAINASGVNLTSAGRINQTAGAITSFSVIDTSQAGSTGVNLVAAGNISLPSTNQIAQVVGSTGNGNETAVTLPGLLSVNISGAGNATLNFTSNLRLLQSTLANGGLTLSTSGTYSLTTPSGSSVTLNKGIQVGGALSAANLTFNSLGDITQIAPISTSNATLTVTGPANSILLNGANNSIAAASLFAPTNVFLYNASDLTLFAVKGSNAGTPVANFINVQAAGNLTVASAIGGTTIASNAIVALHASGSIFGAGGSLVQAPTLSLLSDGGSIGTPSAPLGIATASLAARTTGKDLDLSAIPLNNAALSFGSVSTSSSGFIGPSTVTGVNAGAGNVQILGSSTLAVNSFTNANNTFSVIASNLRVTGASLNITGASVSSFSADVGGAVNFNANGGFQINNLSGGVGIMTPGAVTLNSQGNIGGVTGTAGSISAANLFASVSTGAALPSLFLGNPLNAVTGSVTLNAPGNVTFFNSVNTNIIRASFVSGQTVQQAQAVDIEAFGPNNPILTIGSGVNQSGTSIAGNRVTLRGAGGIVQGGAGQTASNSTLLLFSDIGGLGTATAPLLFQANVLVAAKTNNGDIFLTFKPVANAAFSNVNFNTVGNTSGINAGTGNVQISADGVDISGPATITANNLNISALSIQLDTVAVTSLSAKSAGVIDISSITGFQLKNLGSGPAITTPGDVFLDASNGTISQASGAAGAIVAGRLSGFATLGNFYDNPANAISGGIMFGSLGDATLVNSLATHLVIALAGGTLTVQSAGDLELAAGPNIASLSNGQGIEVHDTTVLGGVALSQIGGILASLRSSGDGIVLSTPGRFINNAGATALLLSGGARFLIYSADPALDTFGGLKTAGAGIFGTSYPTAITATGSRYIFSIASSTNRDFIGGTLLTDSITAPQVVGFVSALQPPPRNPPPPPPPTRADVLILTGQRPPPPPPPPPPRNGPLADLSGPEGPSSEPPSSSDQATSYVVGSLEGGPPTATGGSGGGTIIPRFLRASTPPPSGTLADTSVLSGFGNTSLWQ